MVGDAGEQDEEHVGKPGRPLLFIDSDLFALLAAAGLLDRVIIALGFAIETSRRLDALPAMVADGKQFRDLTPEERDAVLLWCRRIQAFRGVPDADLLQEFALFDRPIQPGEAAIFAWCLKHPDTVFATGDKNAVRSLAACAPHHLRSLGGRIHCLEQILEWLVQADGVAAVHEHLEKRIPYHKTLIVCLSEECRENPPRSLELIGGYLKKLLADLGDTPLRAIP